MWNNWAIRSTGDLHACNIAHKKIQLRHSINTWQKRKRLWRKKSLKRVQRMWKCEWKEMKRNSRGDVIFHCSLSQWLLLYDFFWNKLVKTWNIFSLNLNPKSEEEEFGAKHIYKGFTSLRWDICSVYISSDLMSGTTLVFRPSSFFLFFLNLQSFVNIGCFYRGHKTCPFCKYLSK